MEKMILKVTELVTLYGIKVITAVIIFIIGRWVAKLVEKAVQKVMNARKSDATLTTFLSSLIYIAILAFVVIAALGQLGIQTTSFVAIIGAAGLAVGLALQGSLSNFAAGFMMIIFRPVNVGDYIITSAGEGTVDKIQIFTTEIVTADNKVIIMPNAKLTSDNIINWSTRGSRRIDLNVTTSYAVNVDKVKQIISEVLDQDSRILKDPAPTIAICQLGDVGVHYVVRPWAKVELYWDVYFGTLENIKKRFETEGITMPHPHRTIHVVDRQSV